MRLGEAIVRIDDRPVMLWPDKHCVDVTDLSSTKRHKITVFRAGKAHQSFSFEFSKSPSKKLCLFLNDLYWTVQLWESKQAPWCKCK